MFDPQKAKHSWNNSVDGVKGSGVKYIATLGVKPARVFTIKR